MDTEVFDAIIVGDACSKLFTATLCCPSRHGSEAADHGSD
jgi:hypothetical protein